MKVVPAAGFPNDWAKETVPCPVPPVTIGTETCGNGAGAGGGDGTGAADTANVAVQLRLADKV
ncbi:hypothetical protein ACE4Z5_24665, partial [Salmonella enterica]|uniref:hypothetical protein n=1 Tax=Salmonella enterica TaxID=28901 RepID=UPI003D2A6EEB